VGDRPWAPAKYRREAALLAEAKMRGRLTQLALEGVHEMWELSVLQANHAEMDQGPVSAVVAALEHLLSRMRREDAGIGGGSQEDARDDEEGAGWMGTPQMIAVACSAAWALCPSTVPRRTLIQAGAVEALLAALAAAGIAPAPAFAAQPRSKGTTGGALEAVRGQRHDDDQEVMQARAAGALAVMAVDPHARRRIFDVDPTLARFLQPVYDHFPDPKPRATRHARKPQVKAHLEAQVAAEDLADAAAGAAAGAGAGAAAATAAEEDEAVAARVEAAAMEAGRVAGEVELAALQSWIVKQRKTGEQVARATARVSHAASVGKRGGNVLSLSGPHPIMESADAWRVARAVVLSETVGTLLVRDAPGRVAFIRAGGIVLLMRILARASETRVIVALTSVLAAFADDQEALRAIAEAGDSTAMFQGMVPPLAAAIERLEAVALDDQEHSARHDTLHESAGLSASQLRNAAERQQGRRRHGEQLRVAQRLSEMAGRALWGGAQAVVLDGHRATSTLAKADIDNLLEVVIDTIALPPHVVLPAAVTNVVGALAALARDRRSHP
jgi:hypothetical protein